MADELAAALEEVITREAHRTLRQEIDAVFRAFETGLADLCNRYDAALEMTPEFQERYRALKQQVFIATSESAKLRATEQFIRKVTSPRGE
jgi:hypothetical protein